MRRPLLVAGLLVTLLGLRTEAFAGGPDLDDAQKAARLGLGRAEVDVLALENAIAAARSDVGSLVAQARYFPIEQRLVDADLFFETDDYEKAATLYRDLVETPQFRQRPGWDRAVFQLGESLYRQRGYVRAREFFREAAGPLGGKYRSQAMARLFEIAVRTTDFAAVEDLEGEASGALSTPEVSYAYGKYLEARGRRPAAAEAFLKVAPGSGPYARAQYFLGVQAASRQALDEAFGRFALAASQPVNDDADRDVQGNAMLAKGRVLCAQGRGPECMQALQEVDRGSVAFPQALFELAWAHFKADDLAGAARTLEILLVTSPEGDLALKANALRGRILTRLNDTEGAQESYQQLSDVLVPVATELDRLILDPKSIRDAFDFVMDKGQARDVEAAPITERSMKWLKTDRDMVFLVGIFEDLRRQREDVRESMQIVESLLWALRSGGQLEAFPALKERYLRLKEAEGLAIRAALESVRSVRQVVRLGLSGEVLARYDSAISVTELASRGIAAMPVSLADYRGRERNLGREVQELGGEVFQIDSVLRLQRQQLLAIDQWLQEQQFAKEGPSLTPEREAGLRSELGFHLGLVGRFETEATVLRERLAQETLSVNTPESMKSEDTRRVAVLNAVRAEARVLQDASSDLAKAQAELASDSIGLVDRSAAGLDGLGPVQASLLEVVGRGARDFEASVLREKSRMEQAASDFQMAELDAQAMSESEGARILHAVRERLGTALLEADLGLADMAWQREEKVASQLREIGKEFGLQMKVVDSMEKALKDDEAEAAPQSAAPQGPAPIAP
jgi:tetratricopeptide (TPR) repeat protein